VGKRVLQGDELLELSGRSTWARRWGMQWLILST